MSIRVAWDEHREAVIHYYFPTKWTWQEFLEGFEEELRLASQLDGQRYDIIGDFLKCHSLPPGAGVNIVYSIFKRYPPNRGVTVVVTQTGIIRMMTQFLTSIHPETRHSFLTAATLENALDQIDKHRTHALRAVPIP